MLMCSPSQLSLYVSVMCWAQYFQYHLALLPSSHSAPIISLCSHHLTLLPPSHSAPITAVLIEAKTFAVFTCLCVNHNLLVTENMLSGLLEIYAILKHTSFWQGDAMLGRYKWNKRAARFGLK